MTSTVVRVDKASQQLLAKIAKAKDCTMTQVLKTAITQEYRRWFFQQVRREYTKLKSDHKAWAEELAERKQLDGSLMDGLREEGCYDDPRVAKYFSRTLEKPSGTSKRASARR